MLLRGVTRQNALRRLQNEPCPHCGVVGDFQLFNKTFADHSQHVGLSCRACGREHPLRSRGVMWIGNAITAWMRGRL
jgi:hypothetical protein